MASKDRLDSVYVIFDTETRRLWSNRDNTKIGWVSAAAAKSSWGQATIFYDDEGFRQKFKFDDQTRYQIIRLHEDTISFLAEGGLNESI